jgi:hypothetical protein
MKTSTVVCVVPVSDGKTRLDVAGIPLFELNPVATAIWAKLAEGLSRQEIINYLVDTFGVSEERISGDVEGFIEVLKDNFLISDDS